MKGFKNAEIYVEGKGIVRTNLAVENGKIVAIGDYVKVSEPFEIDEGAIVFPGFIDQHVHGAAGSDAMDGTKEDLNVIANALAGEGTTSFLATTMTQSTKNIVKALEAIGAYVKSDVSGGARLLGAHLEGPFISEKFVGAQPPEYVAKPSVENFSVFEKASGDTIKIVTLAVEKEGANELLEYFRSKGITPSIGHTSAKYADVGEAICHGLKNVTHTYNAQTPVHHREVGVVGAALLFDSLNCEIICDMIHLSAPAIKLVVKNKPHDKVTLITDAMRAKHLPDGESELGGQTVIVSGGEARLKDGTLAGSVLKMNDAIKNVVLKAGVPLTDAVDFATINPAKNLGVDDLYGSIRVGKVADFAVLNEDFSVACTIRDGEIVFKAR